MNRSPAFQFYADKWQSHTRRLSNDSYRVFHELICWMWQHSPDYCSIQASAEAVACALAMPTECVRIALAEINNPFAPLLKTEGERWVSNGLRKEAEKQAERSTKARFGADARWKQCPTDANASPLKANASQTDANASFRQCLPTPSPSPSPTPSPKRERATPARPSVEEVKAYCKAVNLPESDGEWFLDKCEASGWKNGGQPIISWKATIRTWKRCGFMCSQKSGTTTTAVNGTHAKRPLPGQFL